MQSKNVAFYIRLSIEDLDSRKKVKSESDSISNQRNLLLAYYNEQEEFKNSNLLTFCDDGFSGTNFERPQFVELMKQVRNREIDCIVVKDFSRFGRDYLELGNYLEQIFPALGVRFISINDNYDSNIHFGMTGGMDVAFKNLVYSLYSRDLSQKIKSARESIYKRGEFIGNFAAYGYLKSSENKRKLVVDHEVAPIIQDIFYMAANGKSTYEIARILNGRRIPCPYEHKRNKGVQLNKPLAGEKAVWGAGTVKQIIKDERYTGIMVSNRHKSGGVGKQYCCFNPQSDWIKVEGTHEPIVSEEEFILANEGLASRLKTINYNTAWKNSKNIFICGHCGRRLQKSTGKVSYLYCMTGKADTSSDCSKFFINQIDLENYVLASVQKMVLVFIEAADFISKRNERLKKELEAALKKQEKQMQALKNSKFDLYSKYKDELISKEQFLATQQKNTEMNEAMQKLWEEKKAELAEIKATEQQIKQTEASFPTEKFKEFSLEAMSKIIDKVIIYDSEHIEIKFNHADNLEKVIHISKRQESA